MKKILLTSALAISIACPSFATGIDKGSTNPGCTDTVLGTATGPASLEADWSANIITLKYKNQGTDFNTGSCAYDQSFDLPQAPTRTGYNFAGWKVKTGPAMCTAASINNTDKTSKGTAYATKRLNGNSDDTYGGATAATYGISTPGEWGVTLAAGGIVKGMARCATNSGTYAQTGTPKGTTGRYCWCQTTSYTPTNGEMCMSASSSWVYKSGLKDADYCAGRCASYCAINVQNDSGFRGALLGLLGA